MIIYLHVELFKREIESKILLAIEAVARGHSAVICDRGFIERGLRRNALPAGVFHTKSLTPNPAKLRLHGELTEKGFTITSLDEELSPAGSINPSEDVLPRFSSRSISQADAIFMWGSHDSRVLEEKFPHAREKFFATGSPRVDFWDRNVLTRMNAESKAAERPYVLAVSSFSNTSRPFHLELQNLSKLGYMKDRSKDRRKFFDQDWKSRRLQIDFIEAIEFLADGLSEVEILFRPHPSEDPRAWEIFFQGTKSRVRVVPGGSLGNMIANSLGVVHTGSTVAFEAHALGTEVFTFRALEGPRESAAAKLGVPCNSKEELKESVWESMAQKSRKIVAPNTDRRARLIEAGLFVPDSGTSASKIVDAWEALAPPSSVAGLKISRKAEIISYFTSSLRAGLFGPAAGSGGPRDKFPRVSARVLNQEIERIARGFGFVETFSVKPLGSRAFLVSACKAAPIRN